MSIQMVYHDAVLMTKNWNYEIICNESALSMYLVYMKFSFKIIMSLFSSNAGMVYIPHNPGNWWRKNNQRYHDTKHGHPIRCTYHTMKIHILLSCHSSIILDGCSLDFIISCQDSEIQSIIFIVCFFFYYFYSIRDFHSQQFGGCRFFQNT